MFFYAEGELVFPEGYYLLAGSKFGAEYNCVNTSDLFSATYTTPWEALQDYYKGKGQEPLQGSLEETTQKYKKLLDHFGYGESTRAYENGSDLIVTTQFPEDTWVTEILNLRDRGSYLDEERNEERIGVLAIFLSSNAQTYKLNESDNPLVFTSDFTKSFADSRNQLVTLPLGTGANLQLAKGPLSFFHEAAHRRMSHSTILAPQSAQESMQNEITANVYAWNIIQYLKSIGVNLLPYVTDQEALIFFEGALYTHASSSFGRKTKRLQKRGLIPKHNKGDLPSLG